MKTLNALIRRQMYRIISILMLVTLTSFLLIKLVTEQSREYGDAVETLRQIEMVIRENEQELAELKESYRHTCIHNAEAAARIIESDESLLHDLDGLRQVAVSIEIDEIHIFDTKGRLFMGTHPEYYDFTFDSGEQMHYFKPMLEDKTLNLVQEITPNTAEGKLMQYSAIWTENGKYIIQVGMEPVNVMKATQKNDLSYIFSLFGVDQNIHYCALNGQDGTILASTDSDAAGRNCSELGIDFAKVKNQTRGFYAKLNRGWVFGVFRACGEDYIGRFVTVGYLFRRVPFVLFWLVISLSVFGVILAHAVIQYMDRYVVKKIEGMNRKLKAIADGNLEERLDETGNAEFESLSNYINLMVKSLLDNNQKMSYALSKTNMVIGTYEFGGQMKTVRYTEHIPQIFSLTAEKMEKLAQNPQEFSGVFLAGIRAHPVVDETGIYQYGKKYIRLEEISNETERFGVAIDVTADIQKRMKIERERDLDVLTGLYNRRGYYNQLRELFASPHQLGNSATLMIDADGLKGINDTYGHEKGDIYLKKLASVLKETGNGIASRLGGDEYALFLYGYPTEWELMETIQTLQYMQDHCKVCLGEDLKLPLRFSLGYCLTDVSMEPNQLLNEADQRMYQNKLERKKARAEAALAGSNPEQNERVPKREGERKNSI